MPVNYGSLPFDEAIEYFRRRGRLRLSTQAWDELWQGQHARAFVIAGATRQDMLADFREAVDKAISQGTTLEAFRKDFDAIVARYGWDYRGGRDWRSKVIYDTNLRTAYQAGRWRQLMASGLPYLVYHHSDAVVHPRPLHLAWDGLVLRADNPWWKTHYPPNGWGCQCSVTGLSEAGLNRMGKAGPDAAPAEDLVPDRHGVLHPRGIDPGWDYNVGEAAWGHGMGQKAESLARGRMEALFPVHGPEHYGREAVIPAEIPPVPLGPRAETEEDLRLALRSALGGEEAIFFDPTGEGILCGQALVDHMMASASTRRDGREMLFPLLSDVIRNPYEIWAGFARELESGAVFTRRRYVKAYDLGKAGIVGILVDETAGSWYAFDIYRGKGTALNRLRSGHLIWGRGWNG